VLRGGSFNNNRNNARCAARNRNNPNNRNTNNGFRVVVVVSHDFLSVPEMPPGKPRWTAEALRAGAVCSWPVLSK
jgi:hypothetical protein